MKYAVALFLFSSALQAQVPRVPRRSSQDDSAKSVNMSGMVREVMDNAISIQIADSRVMTFKINGATRFNDGVVLNRIAQGDRLRIQGTQDSESYLTATGVFRDDTAPTSTEATRRSDGSDTADAPRPANTVIRKPAVKDPDDDGPPVLKHGIPAARKSAPVVASAPVDTTPPDSSLKGVRDRPSDDYAAAMTKVSRPRNLSPKEELIERAREWALGFTENLPNYVCQQYTTRYLRNPGSREWMAKDIVSANVVYENGKEDYRNVAINGKPINKKMEEMDGSWSTGEFGTTLRSLFHPGRHAEFTFVKQSQMSNMTTWVYDYKVSREDSDWRIQLGSQSIIPAYQGRVWIDEKTANVLRIEMSATNIPEEFPLDQVEASNDYGFVRLATTDQYMLPTHAETLSCERGSPNCSRNTIEFRNYHKYSGEANIVFK